MVPPPLRSITKNNTNPSMHASSGSINCQKREKEGQQQISIRLALLGASRLRSDNNKNSPRGSCLPSSKADTEDAALRRLRYCVDNRLQVALSCCNHSSAGVASTSTCSMVSSLYRDFSFFRSSHRTRLNQSLTSTRALYYCKPGGLSILTFPFTGLTIDKKRIDEHT